jgi:hypothetical protein
MRRFAFASCIGILALASANAQEFSRVTFDFGGGYTMPVTSTGNYLDPGWSIRTGAGINFSSSFGAMLNLGADSMGIGSPILHSFALSGGNVSVFHATIDPVVRFHYGGGRAAFYLTGGGGLFHRYEGFTPSPAITNGASIPFLGISPASDVTGGGSVNKPGFDLGGGFEIGVSGRAKFFTEAKLEHMFLTGSHMDFIPVSFGFRW